ncbi:MAG: helix-turn-helix transcriptional regulator [Oscillibacter sp.]|nr:helix-turn-helix transcriptional regulator [Oscillibacter sp.]
MDPLQQLGSRLRALRKEKALIQRQMAEFLNITDVHYRRIEAGKVNIPTLTLCTLADYFEVSTDYLLGRTDDRKNRQGSA